MSLTHIEVCSLCCAVCGHGAHVGVCGHEGDLADEFCDCAHSIQKILAVAK